MTAALQKVAIVGAGAFGTALALVALRAGRNVTLLARDPEQVETMRRTGDNAKYLPGVALPADLAVTADPAALRAAELVLFAVPAQRSRAAASSLAAYVADGAPALACAKGVEQATGLPPTQVLAECLPQVRPAALSGPGFAAEIARGLPTAVTIAADEMDLALGLCAALSGETFRPYASDDVAGVELGGAAKNVLAIACGVVAGRGLGESARAALISRGLAEMMRLGASLGARPETFMGLSGLGDLVLTATSETSRNTAFGLALGRGRALAELMETGQPLAEGAHSAKATAELARKNGVDAPIIAAVAAVIDGAIGIDEAIDGLVRRPLKAENA